MSFMERIYKRQADFQQIWIDALATSHWREEMVIRKQETDPDSGEKQDFLDEQSFMRRGYKIQYTAKTGMYELFAIHTSDFYKYPSDAIIDEFLAKGWTRTCDEHQIARNKKQVEKFNRKIDNANKERNDSLMTHWRTRREELINNISSIEEGLAQMVD